MSSSTSNVNGTTIVSGPDIIQLSDFYVKAGILHPLIVGSIAVIALFACLRIGSNRSIAPITCFDWLITVALGSTLAGIVNGNSLVRGLLALATMLFFQYSTSTMTSRFSKYCSWALESPPLVVVFRGDMLSDVMHKHRISIGDIYAALRQKSILSVSEVECAVIEPNGTISIFGKKALEESHAKPESLLIIPGYRKLCEKWDATHPEDVLEKGYGATAKDQNDKRDNHSGSSNSTA